MSVLLVGALIGLLAAGAALVGGQPRIAVDPGRFSPAGTLPDPRAQHTATLLPDGRVLIVGGWAGAVTPIDAALLWDPATETFTPIGPRSRGSRWDHHAVLLDDGRVMIVGGFKDETLHGKLLSPPVSSVELWDPTTQIVRRRVGPCLDTDAVARLPCSCPMAGCS